MPQVQVNATRMELMRVRRRLAVATRGHSLLKDKLDGLMSEFMGRLERYKAARRAFDEQFPQVLRGFALADLCSSPGAVGRAIEQGRSEAQLTVTHQNVAGVTVPRFELHMRPAGGYSLLETAPDLDRAFGDLREAMPRIVALAELEQSVWLLMWEIERTRRRVNALEYVLIPSLRNALRYIRSKLEELERASTVRLMKIKEMRLAQQRAELEQERLAASAP